jgi:hypothetical protein
MELRLLPPHPTTLLPFFPRPFHVCLLFQILEDGTNVNVPGFDNVALAFLTVFQCMTLSGWCYIMYR